MKASSLIILIIVLSFQNILSQNNDAEIINYETKYSISSNNELTEEVSVLIQINTRAGEKLTRVSIPYSENSPIKNLDAQLEDVFGNTIRKLAKKEIVDRSSISNYSLYEDDFVKTFTLKHNVYPYRLSYNYKQTYKIFFNIAYWTPIINSKTPTKKSTLELIIPMQYNIQYSQNNIEEPTIDTIENNLKYIWSSSYTDDYKDNIFSPDRLSSITTVKIVPANFIFGKPGNQESWKDFGNWVNSLNEGLDILPELEKKRIDHILINKATDKEKIHALYKYMQENTRYINVTIEEGGYIPYSASYVSENKYGDCKALSNYMKSILSYAGIQSNYTLIHAGNNIKKIDKNFTSSQFNHAILFIPGKDDTTWLECTSKYNPTGYLGTFTQSRNALIIDKDNSKLIKTPALKISDVEEKRNITFSTDENKNLFAEINFKFKGESYERFEHFSNTLNKDQKDKYIHNAIPFNNYKIERWELNSDNNEFASIAFYARISLKNYIKTYDSIKYMGLFPTEIPSFEKPNKRTQDVQINYPINIKDSLIYQNMKGYNLSLLKDTCVQNAYGSYSLNSKIIPEGLLITKQFILFSNEIELNFYQAFYDFINTIKNIERKSPIIYSKN